MCPTRELCIQIAKDLVTYSKYLELVKVIPVYGGTSIENQIKSIKKGVQVIVGTPGRTKDLINRKILKLDVVNKVVLDEADEMLSMGFMEDLDYILNKTSSSRQTMLFSATMSKEVLSISKKYMKGAKEITVSKINSGAKNVKHHIYNVVSKNKYEALKRIVDYNPTIYGIVFCRTRRETKEIVRKFVSDGYNTDAIHGDLSQSQRDEVMSRFRDKSLQMLIATDVAARGLDVDDLTHVINYSLPDDPEVYTHRSGRTGRAGKNGISIAITNSRESRKVKSIENKSQIKFLKMDVPTGKDICSKQLFKLIDKIEKVTNKKESNFKQKGFNSSSFTNLSINSGRKNGLSPIELISLINRVMKSNKIGIGSIDIRESYSIFEIESNSKNDLIKKLQKIDFNGVELSVLETNEIIQKKFKKKKKSSFSNNRNRSFRSKNNSRKKRKLKKRKY